MRFSFKAFSLLCCLGGGSKTLALAAYRDSLYRRMDDAGLSTTAGASDPMPVLWKCDDLVPNMCDNLIETTGTVPTREGLETYYVQYTSLEASKKNKKEALLPVIVINGGPGMPHDYDLILRQLACDQPGRAVIFYDQAGTGQSAIPDDASLEDYPFLTDIDFFGTEELPALIKALKLDRYHIVSDSYGTQVAMQFATSSKVDKAFVNNLASIVMNGPIPSVKEYRDEGWDSETGTIGTMPPYFLKRYKAIMESQDFESPEFKALEAVLFNLFLYRSGIMVDCYLDAFSGINQDMYVAMYGVSEFIPMDTTMKDFDMFPELHKMKKLPILLTSGEYDVVRPKTVQKMHNQLPLSDTILFANAGHATIGDATGALLASVADFLNRVEEQGAKFEATSSSDATTRGYKTSSHGRHPFVWMMLTGVVALVAGVLLGRKNTTRHHQYETVV